MAAMVGEAKICEAGNSHGMIFPATEVEHSWPAGLRAVMYGICLVYWFMGVAIVADVFMGSIDRVTSKLVQTKAKDGSMKTHKLWNETVATLTLMALGSSAPEIFLAIIDVAKRGFHAGDLGPSTIVGSAAFNLFMIIAVCIFVIPDGEVRVIDNRPAFYVTAIFSLGAYLWMAFVLTVNSPDVVEIWEAVWTGAMLPVLVYVSYLVDKGHADMVFEKLGLVEKEEEQSQEPADNAFSGSYQPNYIKFSDHAMVVAASEEDQKLDVMVMRLGDCAHVATFAYHVEPLSAVAELDFEAADGQIEFGAGETSQLITLGIPARPTWRRSCKLLVVLDELEGNVEFDPAEDGGEGCAVLTVELQALSSGGKGAKGALDRFIGLQMLSAGFSDWGEQWRNVIYCNGSPEEQADASKLDWCLHILALPWKVVFCIFPPTSFFGGWVAFYSSLLGIAAITAGVSDLAEMFGCVLNIPDIITAVTFVALGTSMPDLFASLTAAKEDPNADASIVNVTGSNSVNVFLGLGVPWTMSAIYWNMSSEETAAAWRGIYPDIAIRYNDPIFVVKNKNLGFSVLVFGVVCCAALVILHYRRKWLGGELGGPFKLKVASSVVLAGFWVGWVGIVSWRVLRYNLSEGFAKEAMVVQGMCFVSLCTALSTLLACMKLFHKAELKRRLLEAKEATTEIAKEKTLEDVSVTSLYDVRIATGPQTEAFV